MNNLSCVNLSKSFLIRNEQLDVLENINLNINENEKVAITGKSGSGKSTLLHILAGLDEPTSGHIFLNNDNLSNLKKDILNKIRLENFGFVYQFHHLLDDLTIEENIKIPSLLNNSYNKSKKIFIGDLMKSLDISHRKDHLPWKLSGGEKQRVAIARSIVNNPKFIFLDEPTGNLDSENSTNIHNLLLSTSNKYGIALITATHDNEFIKLFNNVYNLSESKLSIANE